MNERLNRWMKCDPCGEEGGASAGLHCEGGVWSMLFGLLMWDCLFTDIPDTLRTQFQLCPLDLSTPHFYEVKSSGS